MADGYADFLERLFTPQGNSRDTAISLEDDAPSPSLAPQGRNPSLSSHPTARPDFSPLPPASERRPTATPMPRPDRRGNSIGDAISVEHYSRSRFGTSASQVQRDRNRALNKPPSKPTATDTVINLSSDDERDPSQPPAKTPARHQSHSSRADPSQPRPSASRPEPHRRTPLPEADLLNAPSSTTLSSAASSSTPKTPRGPVKDMHRATLSSRFLSNEAPRSPTSMSRREGRLTERPSRSPVTPFSSRTGTSTLTRPSRSGDSLPHGTPSPSEDTVLETAPTQTETSVSNEASKPQEMVSVNQGKSRAVPERSGLNIPAALLDHSDAQGALGLEVGESVDQAKLTEDSRARITDLKRIIERNWPKAADYDDYEDYLLTRGGLSLPEVWSMEFAETLAHVSQLDSVENFLLQAIVFLNRNKLRTPEHRPRGDQIWGELQKGHLVHIAKLIEQTPSGNRRITRPASPLAFSVRTEPATDLGTGASSQIEEDTDSNAFHQRLLERPKRDLVKILKRVEQMVNGERETTQPASPMASLVRTESAADLGTGAFAEIEEGTSPGAFHHAVSSNCSTAPALLSGLSSERLAPAPKYFSENSSGREPPDLSPESPASSYLDESNIAADPQANRERLVQEGGTAANTLHTEEESLEEPESNEPIVNLRIAPRARNILPSAQTEVSNLIERSSNTRQKIDYRDTEGSRQQARASPAPTGQLEKPNEVDVEPLLKAHLTNIRETHAAYVKNLLRRQRQSLDRDLMLEKKSDNRSQSFGSTLLQESSPPFDPFAKLQAIQLPASSNIELGGESVTFTQVTRHPPRTKAIGRTNKLPKKIFKAPVTIYESDEKEVPSYREYALYRTTVLGLNSRELLQWPWGEEETSDALWEDLKAVDYNIPTREKSCLALRIEQSRLHEPYIKEFLDEIGLSWKHVLFWFLADAGVIKNIAAASGTESVVKDIETLLANRDYQAEEIDRNSARWKAIFQGLQVDLLSTKEIHLSAFAASSFVKLFGYSLLNVARYGNNAATDRLRNTLAVERSIGQSNQDFSYITHFCRICFVFNCLQHGEIREDPDSAYETDKEGPEKEDPDSDLERSMNYHISYNFPQTPAQPPLDQNDYRPRYSNEKWQRTKTWNMKERRPFHPCIHAGSCADANCRCFREQIFCERSCSCSASCERRYSGCTCKSKNLPCSPNKGCTCRAVNRECDPELCRGCGAAEALDPNNRYREGGACRNVSILRGVTKKTLLGTSTVHGWGLFTGEDFQQDDYIGEYTGERITETEMSRREVVYQHEDTMYGWGLTDSNIDGTHAGNRLRFINHSRDKKVINCYPRVELCNTIIRIGLYATGPMKAGIELFFDYGYSDEVLKNFKPPKQLSNLINQPTMKSTRSAGRDKDPAGAGVGRKKVRLPTPERRAQTAPGRAAKALKNRKGAEPVAHKATGWTGKTAGRIRKTAGRNLPQVLPDVVEEGNHDESNESDDERFTEDVHTIAETDSEGQELVDDNMRKEGEQQPSSSEESSDEEDERREMQPRPRGSLGNAREGTVMGRKIAERTRIADRPHSALRGVHVPARTAAKRPRVVAPESDSD